MVYPPPYRRVLNDKPCIYIRKKTIFCRVFPKISNYELCKDVTIPIFFVVGITSLSIDSTTCTKEDVSFVNKVAVNKTCKMIRNKQAFGNHKPPSDEVIGFSLVPLIVYSVDLYIAVHRKK